MPWRARRGHRRYASLRTAPRRRPRSPEPTASPRDPSPIRPPRQLPCSATRIHHQLSIVVDRQTGSGQNRSADRAPLPLRPDRLLEGCKHGFAPVAAPVVKRSSREFGGNGCRVRTRSSSAAAGATVQPLDLAAKAGAGAVERRVLTSDLLDRDVALKQRVGLPDPPALPFGCRVGSCTGVLARSRGRAFARASASRRTFTAP